MADNDDKPRRIAIGLHAGGALALRLDADKLDDLRKALTDGDTGWKEIQAVDGSVLVNLAQVLYLRVESDEHKIGF
jgi:hypothetical protein